MEGAHEASAKPLNYGELGKIQTKYNSGNYGDIFDRSLVSSRRAVGAGAVLAIVGAIVAIPFCGMLAQGAPPLVLLATGAAALGAIAAGVGIAAYSGTWAPTENEKDLDRNEDDIWELTKTISVHGKGKSQLVPRSPELDSSVERRRALEAKAEASKGNFFTFLRNELIGV